MTDSIAVQVPAQPLSMAQRLRQVEVHDRLVLAHRTRTAGPTDPGPKEPATEGTVAAVRLVPVPRRARMFVLHGPTQGFAEVVLTSPPRTPTSLFAAKR